MASDTPKRGQGFDLKSGTTDADAVSGYYDAWASTYDETLDSWDYRAPAIAAERLARHVQAGDAILDAGCGTGLFGRAMARHGAFRMVGLDISSASLERAGQRDLYDRLIQHDLQRLPLPIDDDAMAGAASVGVLTYIENGAGLLRDLCRCVRPGGVITFTQRTDRWEERAFATIVEAIAEDGAWRVLEISEPLDYLPGNQDFGHDIKVIHTLCRVT